MDHTKVLLDIKADVATVAQKIDDLNSRYSQGREAQLKKAASDEENFKKIATQLDHKVDKSQIEPLLRINFILVNWKAVAFFVVLLVGMGVISINSPILQKLLDLVTWGPF
jgi:hypothetical protein